MEKKKRHPLARLFFGVFFLLLSAVVLLVNLFRMPGGYDWALGLLDLLTFWAGFCCCASTHDEAAQTDHRGGKKWRSQF